MKSFLRSKRGSVLLVSLVIASVVAIALSSYLQMARTAMQISQRSFLANDAMNVAEAVLEQTLWSFNQTNIGNTAAWANWSAGNANATDDKQRTFASSNFTLAQGASATAKVYVKNYSSPGFPQPIAITEATITPSNGQPIKKEIEIYLTRRSFFSTGLVAKNGVTFSGTNASVDSWNSDPDLDGAGIIPYSTSVRQAHGSVATTSITASVDVQNADIFGYVSVGSSSSSAITLGTNGKISGDFNATNGTRDETRIATNFSADLPDASTPSQIANSDWQYFRENPGNNNYITGAGRCILPENNDIAGNKYVTMANGEKWYCYSVEFINMTGNASNQLVIKTPPQAASPPLTTC
jgi:Tfp pilus assembly protein PilX